MKMLGMSFNPESLFFPDINIRKWLNVHNKDSNKNATYIPTNATVEYIQFGKTVFITRFYVLIRWFNMQCMIVSYRLNQLFRH